MTVRRNLLETGLPLHYYAEGLFHAATCVRQLSKDSLKIVNTVKLPVNSYFAVDLPDDFSDEVAVGFNVGGVIQKIPQKQSLNPIRSTDSSGNFVPYSNDSIPENGQGLQYYGYGTGWGFFWNINDFGEPTGRFFGVGGGTNAGYQVIKERRQIQLTGNLSSAESIVLMYISDGMRADNASQIDVGAWDAINAFIEWKRSPNRNNDNSPEGRAYYNQRRLLRAYLSGVTIIDIKQVLRSSFVATMKN